MTTQREPEHFETVVIGAGQAGLSTGYHLSRRGLPFVILDANDRIGDQWRRRWDSLRLFTPARFAGLDGMPFPLQRDTFPTKDQVADYLESYAARFNLPVRRGVRVNRLSREGERFLLDCSHGRVVADQVVVAMSNYQRPVVPAFAADLDPAITQLHSFEYREPSQFAAGGVLVVGAGNSGAEIALEAAREHETWMAGRDTGHIPFRIDGLAGRKLLVRFVLRVLFHRVLTLSTPIGRRARHGFISKGGPLVRIKPGDIRNAGVQRGPRMSGVEDGKPVLEDGQVLDVGTVVWCTGFNSGFSWIDLPIFDDGELRQRRGIAESEQGLYFVGQEFQYAASSTMIHGVGRDAAFIAKTVAARAEQTRLPAPRPKAAVPA